MKVLDDRVDKAIEKCRKDAIRRDLNQMYQQLGRGNAVPNDKLHAILERKLRTAPAVLAAGFSE